MFPLVESIPETPLNLPGVLRASRYVEGIQADIRGAARYIDEVGHVEHLCKT
jgi:hypothetical protein